MRRFIYILPLLLLISACKDVTQVQTTYISDHSDCQSRASHSVSSYAEGAGSISSKERASMQQQLFCECMKSYEWNVFGCKFKDKDIAKAPAPTQPTVVVVQAPPAAAAVAAPAPVMQATPIAKKVRKKGKSAPICPAPEEYGQQELDRVLNKE